jgi:hypothetical protein
MSRRYFIAGELLDAFRLGWILAEKLQISHLKEHSTEAYYAAF